MIKNSKAKYLFSVVVPVFNVEKYIEEAISSVINQNYNQFEIILVDDGSTDRSGTICDELGKKYENVRCIHKENGGLSDARNVGMCNAKGEYIILLDSDDGLAPNALVNLKRLIIKYNPDIIINRRASFTGKMQSYKECSYYFEIEKMHTMSKVMQYKRVQQYKDCWLGAWLFVIRREYILNNNLFFYKGILHEDEEWVPRVFFSDGNMIYNNCLLYLNRINRTGGITSTYNIKREFDLLKIDDLLKDEFEKDKYSNEVRGIINIRRQSIYFRIVNDLKYYRKDKKYLELVELIDEHKNILNNSKKPNHRVLRLMIKMFGIEKASRMLEIL
nr:glycosyltransferase family A protein [uncultured Agathobacter sp.]